MPLIPIPPRLKAMLLGVIVLSLAACDSDGGGGIFGNEFALSCVETSDVNGGVDVTNTCDSNIIILTDSRERLVISPGDTHRLVSSTGFFRIAACFSPKEPDFDGSEFTCD